MKTEKILAAYRVLSGAKYGKLDDDGKIAVWKITRKLKPVAEKFDEDSRDAAEKFKFDDFDKTLKVAQEYERLRKNGEPTIVVMTTTEYDAFIAKLKGYNKLVSDALNEFADKDVELGFDKLTEDAFGKLMASNDWTMEQTMAVSDVISE